MAKVVRLPIPATFDKEDDWFLENWQCAIWSAQEIHKIIKAGMHAPLTAAQRYRLQSAYESIKETVEMDFLSHTFLKPDEYKEQDALYSRSLGLEPIKKFAD